MRYKKENRRYHTKMKSRNALKLTNLKLILTMCSTVMFLCTLKTQYYHCTSFNDIRFLCLKITKPCHYIENILNTKKTLYVYNLQEKNDDAWVKYGTYLCYNLSVFVGDWSPRSSRLVSGCSVWTYIVFVINSKTINMKKTCCDNHLKTFNELSSTLSVGSPCRYTQIHTRVNRELYLAPRPADATRWVRRSI